jgi:hypothetical protein
MTDSVTVDFDRDRWGRPLVTDPEGKAMKPLPYQRPSSLGKVLSDDSALTQWKLRQVAYGLGGNPHLQGLLATVRDPQQERDKLNDIVTRALDSAGSNQAADYGTTVHACVNTMLEGGDVERFTAGVREYADKALMLMHDSGFTPLLSEQAVVNDELQAAGTFDLLAHNSQYEVFVFDLKTSKEHAPKYSALSWAVQFACYAYSENLYDLDRWQRIEWDTPPSLTVAYALHVPSDNLDAASIVPVDIEQGYRAALLANTVKKARKHKFIVEQSDLALYA